MCCSVCSVLLNVTTTQDTCSLHRCLPPPLTGTLTVSLFTPVHSIPSPWLPSYIDGTQTVLLMLTMAGLFPDRPRVSIPLCFTVCILYSRHSTSLCGKTLGILPPSLFPTFWRSGLILSRLVLFTRPFIADLMLCRGTFLHRRLWKKIVYFSTISTITG